MNGLPFPAPNFTEATIDGQRQAEQFLDSLTTYMQTGDDLHHLVIQRAASRSPEHDAFLRGFCRRLQKELEVRA